MRQRRGGIRSWSIVLAMLGAAALVGLHAQSSRRADGDDLRAGYDTYRSMRQSSPPAVVKWQYLGPTNISGRSTDHAVADKGGPPEYVEQNWDRLVGQAQAIAEVYVEEQAAKAKAKK